MPFTPYHFQAKDVKKIERLDGRALVAWDPGLGKSALSLWYAVRNNLFPCVIVCPASIKWQWRGEAARFFSLRSAVLEGRKANEFTSKAFPVYILNYDILKDWRGVLTNLNPKLIVLDEVHMCGNFKTARTKASKKFGRCSPHVLGLSGTPLVNRPAELWPTLNILRPDLYPNFLPYALEYCAARKGKFGWDFSGASNLDHLHAKLSSSVLIRRRKLDVLKDLPPKTRVVIPFEIDNRGEYDRARSDFLFWARDHLGDLKSSKAAKVMGLSRMAVLKRLAAKGKMGSVFEWIDNFLEGSDSKGIFFTCHVDVIWNQLHARYPKESVVVDGSITGRNREAAFDRFRRDERVRLLFGNDRAAGVGWNGAVADTVGFVEMGWTPQTQMEDRAWRIGQENPVTCYYFVGRGTIEEHLCKINQEKQKRLNEIIDGDGESVPLDVFDKLLESLLREGK